MKNEKIIQSIKGGLIVSCQALPGEPLYTEKGGIMPLMAIAAKEAGASCIRANSVRDILEIKEAVNLPVIGIIKKAYEGYPQHITVTVNEIDALVAIGTDIIAFDATDRYRPDHMTLDEFVTIIKTKYPNQLFMADISTVQEGIHAAQLGIDLIGTTLSGYTPYTRHTEGPDFELIEQLSKQITTPLIAEGRIHTPEHAKKAYEVGAYSVVVGGAITRPKEIAKRFYDAIKTLE